MASFLPYDDHETLSILVTMFWTENDHNTDSHCLDFHKKIILYRRSFVLFK